MLEMVTHVLQNSKDKITSGVAKLFLAILNIWYPKGTVKVVDDLPADAACEPNAVYLLNPVYSQTLRLLDSEELALMEYGLLLHELFHQFYTDFKARENLWNELLTGKVDGFTNLKCMIQLDRMQAQQIYLAITNIIEDAHIERRGKKNYPLWAFFIDFMNNLYSENSKDMSTYRDERGKINRISVWLSFAYRFCVLSEKKVDLSSLDQDKVVDTCMRSRKLLMDAVYENDSAKRPLVAARALEEVISELYDTDRNLNKQSQAAQAINQQMNQTKSSKKRGSQKEDMQINDSELTRKPKQEDQEPTADSNPGLEDEEDGVPCPNEEASDTRYSELESEAGQSASNCEADPDDAKDDPETDKSSSKSEAAEEESDTEEQDQSSSSGESWDSDDEFNFDDYGEETLDGSDGASFSQAGDDTEDRSGKGGSLGEGKNKVETFLDNLLEALSDDDSQQWNQACYEEEQKQKANKRYMERRSKFRFSQNYVNSRYGTTCVASMGQEDLDRETAAIVDGLAKGIVKKLEQEVKTRTEGGVVRNLFNGRLNTSRIQDYSTRTGIDRYRLFERRTQGDEGLDIAIQMLLDKSSSMNMHGGKNAKNCMIVAAVMYRVTKALGIPFRCASFDTSAFLYCDFDHPTEFFDRIITRDYNCTGGTDEANALLSYEDSLLKRPEAFKYLFLVTDGQPGFRMVQSEGCDSAKQWLNLYQQHMLKNGVQMVACCTGTSANEVASIYSGPKLVYNDYQHLAQRLVNEFCKPLRS